MRLLIACLIGTLALSATAAQIYKYTDANGNVVYTNQPPEGVQAEEVDVKAPNTVEMSAPPPALPSQAEQPAAGNPYSVLELTGIPDDEAMRANNGTFSVGVALEPRLQRGHLLRLVLDGQPYGQPTNVPHIQLVNIDRGEHSLVVEVLSGDHVVQRSDAKTFAVQRVNTKSPALRPAPAPKPTPKPSN
ncbi:DUF4124 domain-containing protein [Pseudomonas sp. PIC25]|uniref:DUF4124 domain-containing protein n=1 Tax=Pseudomonas sp. PIC25 TaxID=1958773 RepID=UPI000BAC0336|nr:DUF4124 domain-containing protein [Pseudomonas sp. PIC25]PAU55620.1 DUF4124 domain-containing protein [Pseudomonas sp. PIC25]